MATNLLIVSNKPKSAWVDTARGVLASFGVPHVLSQQEATAQIERKRYDMVMVDASAIEDDIVDFVAQLHHKRPGTPIVVVTTSPTWRRAREVFLAGAADYVRRSFDTDKISSSCREVLERWQ